MKRLLPFLLLCMSALCFGTPQTTTQPTHITVLPGGTGGPVMFQHISSEANPTGNGIPGSNFSFQTEALPANTVAVMAVSAPTSVATVSISDTLAGSWSAAVCSASGAGSVKAWVFVQSLGAAGGIDSITINVGATNVQPVQFILTFWQNISTSAPANGSLCTGHITPTAAGLISPGSFTPGNNNANGGNVVWNYTGLCVGAATAGANIPSKYTPAAGFSLLDGDISWAAGQGFPKASQYEVQATAAAVTPSITATGETTSGNCYNSASVALKVANNGAVAPSNIHVAKIIHQELWMNTGSTLTSQFPTTGSLRVAAFTWNGGCPGGGTNCIRSLSSSDGCAWTLVGNGAAGDSVQGYAQNCAPCPACTVTLQFNTTTSQGSFRLYDVINADPSSFQNEVSGNGACGTTLNNAPTITPPITSGLTIASNGIGIGPGTGVISPVGATFDLWQFTGQTDSDLGDNADSQAHIYFASNATQNWNWTLHAPSSCYWVAGVYKAATVLPTIPVFNNVTANWQSAGLAKVGGIPQRVTQCGSPLTPSGGDDLAQIQAAITACTVGQVVQLGAGTFTISATVANHHIFISKGVSLRGTGTCNNSSSPYCATVINITPGGSTHTYNTGTSNCAGCSASVGPTIFVGPSDTVNGNHPNTWSGCAWSTACNGAVGTIALDADATQGQSTIQVHTTTGFSVGMFVRLDEASGATTYTGPLGTSIFAAADLTNSSGAPATGKIAYNGGTVEDGVAYGALNDRETSEIHQISAIGAGPCPGTSCTLTFDSPVTINYRHSSPYFAQVYQPNKPFVQQAGIENLTIIGSPGGQIGGPINMTFCAYCWIKNVETAYWIGGVILTNSFRSEVTGSYFHDCADCENNGEEYPVALDGATTETLIDNNIFRLTGKGMVGRSCGGGDVIAYNYVDDEFYQASSIGNYWLDMSVNASHYVGCHHALLEGNWGNNGDNDNTHGNIVYHTFFRNWLTGLRTDFNDPSFTDPASSTFNPADAPESDVNNIAWANGHPYPYSGQPNEQRTAGMQALDYWMAFVGNVLGTPGKTIAANGWTYQFNGQKNHVMWMLGWVGGGNNDPNLTGAVGSFFFRHGNYDYLNGSIVDWQSGYTQTLPNSLYLSSPPAFFGAGASCTYTWPWVSSTGTTQLQTNSCSGSGLPAKARWDAGTPFVQP